MKPRFEPEFDPDICPPAAMASPEIYDASHPRFAVSPEAKPEQSKRFVVEENNQSGLEKVDAASTADGGPIAAAPKNAAVEGVRQSHEAGSAPTGSRSDARTTLATPSSTDSVQAELPGTDSDSWRWEVATRVNKYRARRPSRAPRYPSLQLKFDTPEPSASDQALSLIADQAVVAQDVPSAAALEVQMPATTAASDNGETSTRILEFPRSFSAPAPVFDELAESVIDRPRILEVPDLLPPPPALGGMLIEAAEETAIEKQRGFDLPLQTASMSRRFLAAAIDGLLVTLAFALFAYVFFRVTAVVLPVRQSLGISAVLLGGFWAAYRYVLLVHVGTTPGLKLARLQLSRFDGSPAPQEIRRWRVLASVLSALSLALGYAWCFLDEDRLCWHDRITHTYMAPKPEK